MSIPEAGTREGQTTGDVLVIEDAPRALQFRILRQVPVMPDSWSARFFKGVDILGTPVDQKTAQELAVQGVIPYSISRFRYYRGVGDVSLAEFDGIMPAFSLPSYRPDRAAEMAAIQRIQVRTTLSGGKPQRVEFQEAQSGYDRFLSDEFRPLDTGGYEVLNAHLIFGLPQDRWSEMPDLGRAAVLHIGEGRISLSLPQTGNEVNVSALRPSALEVYFWLNGVVNNGRAKGNSGNGVPTETI